MDCTIFERKHFPQAIGLICMARARESEALAHGNPFTHGLPDTPVPALEPYVENGLGVAAVEGDRLVGFLCPMTPWRNHDTLRTHIPLYAHAAGPDRAEPGRLYAAMYARVAEKMFAYGICAHSITFFTHDTAGVDAFFDMGFGKCCTDRIRSRDAPFPAIQTPPEVTYAPVPPEEIASIRPLRRALHRHMAKSPCFLPDSDAAYATWLAHVEQSGRRTYAAYADGTAVAYMDVDACGNSYLSASPDMQNIVGAYCLPTYRGMGITAALTAYVAKTMWCAGYRYLGVEHESANLTARYFWRKHFAAYTYSLLRRL